MSKVEGLMGYELSNQTLPLPTESTSAAGPEYVPPVPPEYLAAGHRFSMADSLGMLRTLSMSGNLGMPSLMFPAEDWQQRRPSGRVYGEVEAGGMELWPNTGGTAQAV
jgi:hypothetical protein